LADAVTLDTWAGTDVGLGQVIDTLADLRRRRAKNASRTAVMTLVVVATTDDEANRAAEAMRALGAHHPARLITLRPEPDARPGGIDAQVALYESRVGDHQSTFNEIRLDVRGEASAHLDAIIEPLTLPDLPVVLWYPGALPSAGEPLLAKAETVVVDTKQAGDERTFAGLVDLARHHTVVDLSWERLRPWRERLAALFDGPAYLPFAYGVTSIEVEGKPAPRHLLAGWLVSRLGTARYTVHLRNARHVSVRLHAQHDSRTGQFSVIRQDDERLVRATVIIEDGPRHHELWPLPDDSLAWSLARALTHLARDRVWEEALAAAVVLPT
jgi:glucose-6-phosphate dehydrogenase assembly protein OpcA